MRARSRPVGLQRAVVALAFAWVGGLVALPLVALLSAVLADPLAVGPSIARHGGVEALARSLGLAAVAVLAGGVFGTAGGIVLARQRFVGRGLLDALVDAPLAVSPVVVGLAFVVLFGRGGWLAPLADAVGLRVLFAWPGLAIATVFVTLPFFVREVALVLEATGDAEEQAARTLGASELQVLRRVTLPNLRGALRAGTLLTVARALGEFGAVLVLGGAVDGRTQTATTLVHGLLEERQEPAAYGLSLVLASVTLALVRGLPSGARGARPRPAARRGHRREPRWGS